MGNETSGLSAVIALFEENCDAFSRLVVNADEIADATDFTGKLHDLSLTAGRVQGVGEALTLVTGDRVEMTLREYLGSSTADEANGRGDHGYVDGRGAMDG